MLIFRRRWRQGIHLRIAGESTEAAHPFLASRFYGVANESFQVLCKEKAKPSAAFQGFFAEEGVGPGSTATDRECVSVYLPLIQLVADLFPNSFRFRGRKPRFLTIWRVDHVTAANDHLLEACGCLGKSAIHGLT